MTDPGVAPQSPRPVRVWLEKQMKDPLFHFCSPLVLEARARSNSS
jgi:hypothetical protein